MRIRSTVCQLLVSLACVGVALPQVVYAFDGPAPPLAPATAAVLDIALDGQGSLHGQASDSNGQALALSEICLRQQGQVLAQTKTDKGGLFTFPGVRAGLYEIQSAGHQPGVSSLDCANAPALRSRQGPVGKPHRRSPRQGRRRWRRQQLEPVSPRQRSRDRGGCDRRRNRLQPQGRRRQQLTGKAVLDLGSLDGRRSRLAL